MFDNTQAALRNDRATATPTSRNTNFRRRCVLMFLSVGMLSSAAAVGQEVDEARAQRLAFMKRKLGELQLSYQAEPDKTLTLTESPLLRFSNLVRSSSSDGGVFLWLDGKRPVAAATIWIREQWQYGHDFVSLSDKPLRCVRNGNVVWTPPRGMLLAQPIENAGEPSPSPPLRLAQMRKLAARFSAVIGAWPAEGSTELRFMPQPLYRYASDDEGVIDGAIFALAVTNDPEVLVQLEVIRDTSDGVANWSYAIARMSALWMKVRLDDKIIWEAEGYWQQPRTLNDPYMENFGGLKPPSAPKPAE